MTEILFAHSYFLKFDPKEYRAMMPYPPLGTLYAAAVARNAGYHVALFDAMLAESEAEIEPHLQRHNPRYLVIYDDDFNYLTKMCLERMRQAAFTMTEMARRHDCIVIVHSSDATDHLAEYFDRGVDYVLVGEAENTLSELLVVLDHPGTVRPEEIPGVVCRDGSGQILRARARTVLQDLDSLPLPARDLIDIEHYRRVWTQRHGYFSLNIVTTRGCPYHCNWCAKPLYGQVYNSHSPERVAQEMAELKRLYTPNHLWFCDDIFGLRPDWINRFSSEVERLDAAMPFKCLSRADLLLRGDTVADLRRAGCVTVWVGAESGSQNILDAMDKGITVEQIHQSTALLREVGIRVGFFLQFGYPGEEQHEIDKTLQMVRTALPDEIGISVSYPLPGTKFYERVKREMGAKRNWQESADLAMLFQGTYSTEFYRVLSRYIHYDHRLHLGLHAFGNSLQRLALPDRAMMRRIALMPYYMLRRSVEYLRMKRLQHTPSQPSTAPEPVLEQG